MIVDEQNSSAAANNAPQVVTENMEEESKNGPAGGINNGVIDVSVIVYLVTELLTGCE